MTLTVPDREMISGRIDAHGDGFVDVAVFDAPRTPIAVLEGHSLYLEWMTSTGVHRLLGRAAFQDTSPIGDSFGVFDVVRFTPSGSSQLVQRREYVRTDHRGQVSVCPTGPGAVAVGAMTIDVSGGGLLIRGPLPAKVGDELHFELADLDHPQGRRIKGRCRVVRETPDGDLGVQFSRIADEDRDHIVAFAYARELAGRRRRMAA